MNEDRLILLGFAIPWALLALLLTALVGIPVMLAFALGGGITWWLRS